MPEIRRNGADIKTIVLKTPGRQSPRLLPGRAVYLRLRPHRQHRDHPLLLSLLLPRVGKRGEYNITVKKARRRGLRLPLHSGQLEGRAESHHLRSAGSSLLRGPARREEGRGSGRRLRYHPFMGMAYAIRDGLEDFDLTILFGSRTCRRDGL